MTLAPATRGTIPLVTVMIPTYCQASVVLRAVDSALAQDYRNIEVVVSDDASLDTTTAVVAGRGDPRIKYHRNPVTLGRTANYRHTLYHKARGDWVVNLDGDDYYTDPHFITAAVDLALSDDRVVMVAARQTTDFGWARVESEVPRERLINGRELLLRLPDARYSFNHLATMYRRATALALDFYRMDVLSADLESLLRLACEGQVGFLDRNVGVWVKHGLNASSTVDVGSLIRNLSIWPSVYSWAAARGLAEERAAQAWRRVVAHLAYGDLYTLLRSGRLSSARTYATTLAQDFGAGILVKAIGELLPKLPYRLAREGMLGLARRTAALREPR